MNTNQSESKAVRKRQLSIDADLLDDLCRLWFPPYVGDSWADRVEYVVHLYIVEANSKSNR